MTATNTNPSSEEVGEMEITLKGYLKRAEGAELLKPASQRRTVPTLKELAAAIGIHEVTLVNIANGKAKLLNLNMTSRILHEMRRRGFEMDVSDILAYRPPETEERQ